MASPAPQITIAKPNKPSQNGILPIPASAARKSAHGGGNVGGTTGKISGPRLKVVIRRLPPGLTSGEFEGALGEDWKLGGGRVDWMIYKAGKISKDAAKPSRPSRVYLHLTDQSHLPTLSDKVRQTLFNDAKNSSNNASLLGPPSVEFAPYGRVPNPKHRNDARQGTIDQDPDFIDFLESLTNPISKPPAPDSDNEGIGKKGEKVTTTPLIQYLREKKASKGKDSASASKGSRHGRQDSKESRGEKAIDKKILGNSAKEAAASPEKRGAKDIKVDKAANEAVKVLNKEASDSTRKPPRTGSADSTSSANGKETTPSGPAAERRRERGNASAAARILQRDLGLGGPGTGRRGTRREAVAENSKTNTAATTPSPLKQSDSSVSASSPESPSAKSKASPIMPRSSRALDNRPVRANNRRSNKAPISDTTPSDPSNPNGPPPNAPSGPAGPTTILRKSTTSTLPPKDPPTPSLNATISAPPAAPSSQPTTTAPSSTSTSTQAFLKHANASQGITESLLTTAFSPFGTVLRAEIDKKKGFAYIDFADPESLQNSIRASPVKVAQGSVVVLERVSRVPRTGMGVRGGRATTGEPRGGAGPGMRGGRGGGRGGRGGAEVGVGAGAGAVVGPRGPSSAAASVAGPEGAPSGPAADA
ncbi:MAG: hypothetical protein M1827_006114 [Pycnora praestabilis]|nr:MAG: hypothetical protein M1827_006114 [Pycnora praestabilis]